MTVIVGHSQGSYPVIIGAGVRRQLGALVADGHPASRIAVIADDRVASVLPPLLANVPVFTFAAGERNKTRQSWEQLTDALLAAQFGRDTVIVAFGGGVATDLAGFVAATYLRGVPWIAVPTTTLAMIDAAVGGKTGVDVSAGKNLVGAFHSPHAVIIDPELLSTLPDRIYRDGLAEAVKHAAALDSAYGEWIATNAAAILHRDPKVLSTLIRRSVELKAEVVSADEREAGRRAVLNAGHTVAHAIEAASDYQVSHGEAVAIGLVVEARLAEQIHRAAPGTSARIASLLEALGLPTTVPDHLEADRLIDAAATDKKNRAGKIRASLLKAFGQPVDGHTVAIDAQQLRSAL